MSYEVENINGRGEVVGTTRFMAPTDFEEGADAAFVGLDVEDLAYAITAAEGFPGWTPWDSERTNAVIIAKAYAVIHNRAPGTDRADASATIAPEADAS